MRRWAVHAGRAVRTGAHAGYLVVISGSGSTLEYHTDEAARCAVQER